MIWLFDLSDLFSIGQLTYKPIDNGLAFTWKNPKKAFNNYDIQSGCIDLFFQLGNGIVRVTDVSPMGFESFSTTTLMKTVSYTHLDVYKRQILTKANAAAKRRSV